ncbi:hypothetical protein S245_001816, partial [Arachis hypogaea]
AWSVDSIGWSKRGWKNHANGCLGWKKNWRCYEASLKSKAVRNKMAAAGEAIDYKCLILFTNGKKTIPTSIQSWFEDRLQDLPDVPNNELMIPEDPKCNKEVNHYFYYALLIITFSKVDSIENGIPLEHFGHGHPDPNLTYAKDLVNI